jgi:alkylation response protein AidB-like acyl-CoA dehydrogenase
VYQTLTVARTVFCLFYRITNGIWSDFFTTAVRTGPPGHSGVSLLVIPRTEGVKTERMKCQGVWASGTTYITFENVKVPVENLIGKENEGFKAISKLNCSACYLCC